MCGLVGIVDKLRSESFRDTKIIESMVKIIKHRGPDDIGYTIISTSNKLVKNIKFLPTYFPKDINVFFGFCRLSIQDLSVLGHQPMISKLNKSVLMMNGEIYNATELKKILKEKRYNFIGTSDTEVVLNAIIEFGFHETISKLNGMFAIVYYDNLKNKLYFARDIFGIKPLYIANTANFLSFSSELKSFKFLKGFSFVLNKNNLDEHLLFGNVRQETLFKDIKNLEPGTILEYDLRNNEISYSRFNCSVQSEKKDLADIINDEINSQLVSDVPVGLQLSGGVDSSLVAYFANLNYKKKLNSFSILFKNKNFSEKKYIDIILKKIKMKAHSKILDSNFFFKELENATWHLEHPINHSNSIGIYLLCKYAKKNVKVLLSGEGADEIFGGYPLFVNLQNSFTNLYLFSILKFYNFNILSFFKFFILDETKKVVMSSAVNSPFLIKKIFPNFELKKALEARENIYKNLKGNFFERLRKYMIITYLPSILTRQDKMSMAHSLETRVPFLGANITNKAFSLSYKEILYKNKIFPSPKRVIKDMSSDQFGKYFAFRKKSGFGLPLSDFFQSKYFERIWKDCLSDSIKSTGIFSFNNLDKIFKNLKYASSSEIQALWTSVSFEIWYSKFIKK